MSGEVNRSEGNKGQFSSAIPGQDTVEIQGNDKHQPGKLVGNDALPTFQAETLPAGTAPASRTFQPNPTDSVPPAQQNIGEGEQASAADTLGGATSGDVHTGLGHPGAGQSSKELHDGSKTRTGGVEGVGASGVKQSTIDPHDPQFANQRAADKDEAVIGRGDKADAQDREPVSAEQVASERK
ncbi:hypothetical protein HII31_04387 [Pseudocercospora fuligena]|uniref:Uncharacterized protein n=1 Tax=Pseudocercospora fuligena TaxID=685502 RepID=A0A8H6VN75_9PEZI|nr:hypothetical protein HII31_04387 [Pseudocercospora fuligena]